MTENRFYEVMNSLEKKELFKVLIQHEEYNQEAVEAAILVVKEKNYVQELKEIVEKMERKSNFEKSSEEAKSAKLANINLKNCIKFSISSSNQINFEGQLIKHNIEFYRSEGYNIDTLVMNYYFSDEDFDKAKWLAERNK